MRKHVLAAVVVAVAAVAPARAQDERSVIIQRLPTNTATPVAAGTGPGPARLTLRTEPGNRPITIGERFNICFASNRDGFVSLWWIDAGGTVQRLYPNPWSPANAKVYANSEACVGRDGGPFSLTMGPPSGRNDVFLIWTANEQAQPSETAFRNVAADAAVILQPQTPSVGGQGGQFLTVGNGQLGGVGALSVFSRALRAVIVQPTVPQADWQTQHLMLQSAG
jgi:hypothetical protein